MKYILRANKNGITEFHEFAFWNVTMLRAWKLLKEGYTVSLTQEKLSPEEHISSASDGGKRDDPFR